MNKIVSPVILQVFAVFLLSVTANAAPFVRPAVIGVKDIKAVNKAVNNACTEGADLDGDCVADDDDNCPMVANADQKDNDFDGIGDACEGDWDNDGVKDQEDNCWDLPNADQADLEGDRVGDLCDPDRDGDGYTNDHEAGVIGTDPDKWDTDGDHVSDYYDCSKRDASKGVSPDCDSLQIVVNSPVNPVPLPDVTDPLGDDDNDGVANGADNCPDLFNPGQQDIDEDGNGDLCDNGYRFRPEMLFAQGGGGLRNGGGCSVIGAVASADGPLSLFALIGLPGLAFGLLRRRCFQS